jgi:hypothetical protein
LLLFLLDFIRVGHLFVQDRQGLDVRH